MADIQTLKGKITSTIYPNGKGAINAADHQALLLEMADGMAETDTKLTELSEEVSEVANVLSDSTTMLVDGFETFDENGTTNSQFVTLFQPTMASDVVVNRLRLNRKGGAAFFIKVASVGVNASNQVIANSVSSAIEVAATSEEYQIMDIDIEPFIVKSGERLGVVVSEKNFLRLGANQGTSAFIGAFPSGDFNSFVDGSRISSNIAYVNFNQKVLIEPYSVIQGGFKNVATIEDIVALENRIGKKVLCLEEEIANQNNNVAAIESRLDTIKNDLDSSIAVSKYDSELMAHCATIYDGEDGSFYIPYYGSDVTASESIGNDIVCRLIKVSQYNQNDRVVVDVLKKGEKVGDITQSASYAPYDPNILVLDDKLRYYMVCGNDENRASLMYRDIAKGSMELGTSLNYCTIRYTINGVSYSEPTTKANLDNMLNRYFGQASGATIGIYPIFTTQFVKDGNDVYGYLAGLDAGSTSSNKNWSGCLVKSSDNGITWDVIAWANDLFEARVDYPMWEASIQKVGTRIYILFKYADTPIAYYDTANNAWSELIYLFGYYGQDATIDNSKPCLYFKDSKLYAMQNVLPRIETEIGTIYRSRMKVLRLSLEMQKEASVEITHDSGVQYMTICNQRGHDWFCFTEDKTRRNYQMKGNISIIPLRFLPTL